MSALLDIVNYPVTPRLVRWLTGTSDGARQAMDRVALRAFGLTPAEARFFEGMAAMARSGIDGARAGRAISRAISKALAQPPG